MIVTSGCSDFHWWERFITHFLEKAIFSQVWTFRWGHPKKSLFFFYFCNLEGKRNLNLPNFPLSSGMSTDTLSKTTRQRGPLCSFFAVSPESPAAPKRLCNHRLTQVLQWLWKSIAAKAQWHNCSLSQPPSHPSDDSRDVFFSYNGFTEEWRGALSVSLAFFSHCTFPACQFHPFSLPSLSFPGRCLTNPSIATPMFSLQSTNWYSSHLVDLSPQSSSPPFLTPFNLECSLFQ